MPFTPRDGEKIALVLQGGGALGSYQGGIYEELAKAGVRPGLIAGISIGAINAALIAGGPPDGAVGRLREFWNLISSSSSPVPFFEEFWEQALPGLAAQSTLMFGAPGFFRPKFSSSEQTSYYDTADLYQTLHRLVDFGLINRGGTRLIVGAVNVQTGNFVTFDSAKMPLGPEHIMASGALPPGLPPIRIENEFYWDGGLVSNTPLQFVIDEDGPEDMLAFQVDLFPARGPMPTSLLEVAERDKDIRYSSRTRLNSDVLKQKRLLRAAACRLAAKLPAKFAKDPDLALLTANETARALTLVQFIYKSKHSSGFSKDYEFTRASVDAHWAAGQADALATLSHREFRKRGDPEPGDVIVLDLAPAKESKTA